MAALDINFGKTSDDYSQHRAGFPPELFERLAAQFGIGLARQRVLDIGAGTGTLARGFAARGCHVSASDLAWPMLAAGMKLAAKEGVTVAPVVCPAEVIPTGNTVFDGVSAGQCWHWFDRPQAAQEVRRILKPGGWLTIPHFDWLPLPGNVVEATERLILDHNPLWAGSGGDGFHTTWVEDVTQAEFDRIETFTFDQDVLYSHDAWRGRIRASAGIAASLPPEQVAVFDAELRDLLRADYPDDPLIIPHRTFALVCWQP